MPKTFHGRLDPGVVTDGSQVITLCLHEPRTAPALTLKIWEHYTYVDANGAAERDQKEPVLLATLVGDLAPTRKFTVTRATIETDDKDGKLLALELQVSGSATVHKIPLPSEKDEVEGRTYEIGFSIEANGAEVFRSKSPCLFHPRPVFPTAIAATYAQLADTDNVYEETLRHRYATLGASDNGKLTVLASGYVDLHGHLVDAVPEDGKPPPQPIPLRKGRELYAYLTRQPVDLPLGPSQIPIAICDPVADDGTLVHRIPIAPHPWAFRILEQEIPVGGAPFEEPAHRDPPPLGEGELERAFREMDAFLRARLAPDDGAES